MTLECYRCNIQTARGRSKAQCQSTADPTQTPSDSGRNNTPEEQKTPEEGGRTHGIKTGYRPNHVFEPPNVIGKLQTWIGQIEFDDQEFIQPGETKILMFIPCLPS